MSLPRLCGEDDAALTGSQDTVPTMSNCSTPEPYPLCQCPGDRLTTFPNVLATYDRCVRCAHVWAVGTVNGSVWHVTPPPERLPDKS